ncbi:MAG TPA: winged helix-turn-helix domain-containing protein [Nitrososphaerales archaeon]|nr:winged helix-turn-helix domain-containing protein [Nitrososphaerales archaeon]
MRESKGSPSNIGGTTLRIYKLLFKEAKPLSIREIQVKANLSSSSVAHYHVSKLVDLGLVSEKEGGYVVEKVLFENMIRIGRSFAPLQTTFAIFFGTTLVALLFVVRPSALSSLYLLSVLINCVALGIFSFQAIDTLRKWKV